MSGVPAEIRLDATAAVPIVRVRGDIDIATVAGFRTGIGAAADLGRGAVIVSLLETTYCDSLIVQALLALRARLEAQGQRLLLVLGERGTPRRVLDIVGATKRFPVFASVAAALLAAEAMVLEGRTDPRGDSPSRRDR